MNYLTNTSRLFSNYFKIGLLFSLVWINSGCATHSTTHTAVPLLELIEPASDTTAQQIAVKRLSDLIEDPEFAPDQQAELYLQRGLTYDMLGLMHLAYFDFLYAIELKPDLAEAYNMLGVYYLRQTEYSRSYESFDAVIELDSQHEFAYLNRAIALYYGDRAKLAEKDFESFYRFNPQDAFRVIWWYFAKSSYDPAAAIEQLNRQITQLPDDSWGTQIALYVKGQLTAEQLLEQAVMYSQKNENSAQNINQSINQNLCEAYFYIAKQLAAQGKKMQAADYFNAALKTAVFEFVEYRYAHLELQRLSR
ncbi:hypothetical protein N7931_11875 [Catenovulum sp. 2E275]|uniref:lipoprotein NlpI n=1 Tax=Catenovulum sp. 2E275 TaxID=2980497 RepID=UPI0021D1C2CB|nr:lipoprotein NlpI [Catenovulum sp. 2E275]MCU4676325.1 hypothetical protein [Catenovulum sp. 2E275]